MPRKILIRQSKDTCAQQQSQLRVHRAAATLFDHQPQKHNQARCDDGLNKSSCQLPFMNNLYHDQPQQVFDGRGLSHDSNFDPFERSTDPFGDSIGLQLTPNREDADIDFNWSPRFEPEASFLTTHSFVRTRDQIGMPYFS